ncbi:MAG: hypothetical protein ACF8PN_12670 [Phycisphaerales bacterium]
MRPSCRASSGPVYLLLPALAGFVIAAPANAQVEYELVIIEPWNQTYSLATSRAAGINNRNEVSGCATPLSGLCSFLWTFDAGKTPIDLAGAINDAGVIAGGGALRYPDGTIVSLPEISSANDLNESNVVAAQSTGRYWGGCRYTRSAKVWDESNGTRSLEGLGVPAAHEARAINELNQVVGVRSTTGSCGDFEAYLFDLNTLEHIDIHDELLGGTMGITEVFDINDFGVVVGEGPFGTGIGEVGPFLWSVDDGFFFLPAIPNGIPMDTHADAINNRGEVVGGGIVDQAGWHGFIWDERNGIRDLNDITSGIPADFVIDRAIDINENGWIIGSGHYGVWSPERAVVLIPVDGDPYELAIDQLVANERTIFSLEGATPDTNQYLVYSLRGEGSTPVPPLNVTLDLEQPNLFASGRADHSGRFETTVRVPANGRGRPVWFQAAEMNRVSNVLAEVVR